MNEERIDELGNLSITMLMDFMKPPEESTDDQKKLRISEARIAATVLSSCTRFHQVARARDAMNFLMARELADDDGRLQKYMRLTMPESPVIGRLTDGQSEVVGAIA